jgi:Arc/MetJ-type ribon-helix-helix transcriptional regulator
MARSAKAYVAAMPASAIPELQELLCRFTGSEGKRGNVVMVRLGDEALGQLDGLVESGLFGSRSEAAAFLIGTGIDANEELLKQAAQRSAQIRAIRLELNDAIVRSLRKRRKGGKAVRRSKGQKAS